MHFIKLYKLQRTLIIVCFYLVVVTDRLISQTQNFYIPLVVSEALKASTTGVSRSAEPVTVGIPIADHFGVKSIDALGIAGSSAYQFRVLDRWPSGNLKWVLADFLAELSANRSVDRYALSMGTGTAGGPNLAQELSGSIWVKTGAIEFEISKTNFNLFRQVIIDGKQLVDRDKSPGIILVGADGVIYSSRNDPSPKVIIEENGPVRAVIKAQGGHYNLNGKKLLDYTIRMHFYKGKSRARLFYTLRNANRNQVINGGVQYLDLRIKTTILGGQFQLPSHDKVITGVLAANDSASIYQAYSTYPQHIDWGFVPPIPKNGDTYEQEGFRISKNLSTLASAGRGNYPDLFYCKLSSSQGTAVGGIRFAAGWWPKSLQTFADGTLAIGLWPKFNPHATYIRFGSHNTYEVLLEFSKDPQFGAAMAMKKFQYPLIARAAVSWYNQSQALYEKIVSFSDEAAYFSAQGWPATPRRPEGLKIYRYKYWGEGGGGNQYDFTRINLINFIREVQLFGTEYLLMAEQRLQYNADWAVYHSDNFDPAQKDIPPLQGPWGSYLEWPIENQDKVSTSKVIFESSHRHWYGMALYYYMTGDERFKDAIQSWGEYLSADARTDQNKWTRALSWNIFGLTELYRFTHDSKYLNQAKQLLRDEVINPVFEPIFPYKSWGIDWKRGYFMGRSVIEDKVSYVAPFMLSAIFYRALQLLYDELPANDPDKPRLRDLLTGISWFTYYELWFEYGTTPGSFGYPYHYDVQNAPPADVRTVENWYGGLREVFEVVAKGYELTGDSRFLSRVQQTLKNCAYNTQGTYWYQDYPGLQQMLFLMKNYKSLPVWRPLEMNTTRNNDGSYTLVWVVPSNARQIQIKYSEKKLVEWLGFNRYSRNYQYDPATHEAYFKAAELSGVPQVGQAGKQQSMKVTNLAPGKVYSFIAKVYLDNQIITEVDDKTNSSAPPENLELLQNYPNPFNPETTVQFELPHDCQVVSKVFDLLGKEVITLSNQPMVAGSHSLKWNGRDLNGRAVTSGIYFLQIQTDKDVAVKKMMLMR